MSKQKEMLEDITAQLQEGVKKVFESGQYQKYLDLVSRLPRYSSNNLLLIYKQNPEASMVAGFKKWQEFGRYVKKNEKGLKILAPMPYKKQIAEQNASGQLEEKEITIVNFKTVYVFDISQTDGKPIPELVHRLEANVQNFSKIMEGIEKVSPYPIYIEKMHGYMNGYCDNKNQKIAIRDDISEAQKIKTILHEIAHARLHSKASDIPKVDKKQKEVEAESVAYIITNYYGIDSSDYSFGYVAGWSAEQELEVLQQSIKTIQNEANQLIQELDQVFKELELENKQQKECDTEITLQENCEQNHVIHNLKFSVKEQLEQAREQRREQPEHKTEQHQDVMTI